MANYHLLIFVSYFKERGDVGLAKLRYYSIKKNIIFSFFQSPFHFSVLKIYMNQLAKPRWTNSVRPFLIQKALASVAKWCNSLSYDRKGAVIWEI